MFRKIRESQPGPVEASAPPQPQFSGFAIPADLLEEDDDNNEGKNLEGETLVDILMRLYEQKDKNFIQKIFDNSLENSCAIFNELFEHDIKINAETKETEITLISPTSDTNPIILTKNKVTACFENRTPAQKARQALEMAYCVRNNPLLMNSKKGIPIIAEDPETAYFLFLAAQKMGFGDKVIQSGYKPPSVTGEQKIDLEKLIDNETKNFATIAKGFVSEASTADKTPPTPEPVTATQNTKSDEAPASSKPKGYALVKDFVTSSGSALRDDVEEYISEKKANISGPELTKIFKQLENDGVLSKPKGNKGRQVIKPTTPKAA